MVVVAVVVAVDIVIAHVLDVDVVEVVAIVDVVVVAIIVIVAVVPVANVGSAPFPPNANFRADTFDTTWRTCITQFLSTRAGTSLIRQSLAT